MAYKTAHHCSRCNLFLTWLLTFGAPIWRCWPISIENRRRPPRTEDGGVIWSVDLICHFLPFFASSLPFHSTLLLTITCKLKRGERPMSGPPLQTNQLQILELPRKTFPVSLHNRIQISSIKNIKRRQLHSDLLPLQTGIFVEDVKMQQRRLALLSTHSISPGLC